MPVVTGSVPSQSLRARTKPVKYCIAVAADSGVSAHGQPEVVLVLVHIEVGLDCDFERA